MPSQIHSGVLQSNWTPSGETTTGVLLFQSIATENENDCQFLVRLKYGLNGLETPIYTENKGIFLEPGSSALIDFRSLVPDTFSFGDPNIRWVIETRLGFNFSPITIRIQQFDTLSFEQELTLVAVNGKADKIHTHQESDIAGLTEKLDSYLTKPANTPQAGQVLKAIDANTYEWGTASGGITGDYVSSVNGQTGDVTLPSYQLATYQQDGLLDAETAGVLRPQFQSSSTRIAMVVPNGNRIELIGTDEYSFGSTNYWVNTDILGGMYVLAGHYYLSSSTITAGQTVNVDLSGDYGNPYRVAFTNLTLGNLRMKPFVTGEKMTILDPRNGTKLSAQSEYILAPNKVVYVSWSKDYLADAFLLTIA